MGGLGWCPKGDFIELSFACKQRARDVDISDSLQMDITLQNCGKMVYEIYDPQGLVARIGIFFHSEDTLFEFLSMCYDISRRNSVQNVFFCFPGRSEKEGFLNRVLRGCIAAL